MGVNLDCRFLDEEKPCDLAVRKPLPEQFEDLALAWREACSWVIVSNRLTHRLSKVCVADTPQQISEAFRRHVDLASMTWVKAGDFKKANVSTKQQESEFLGAEFARAEKG